MTVTYTTAANVASLLGITLSTTSKPTVAEVEAFINRKEDFIDDKTGHAWRTVSVSEEYVEPRSGYSLGLGVPFKLLHRKIQSITKLELWDGSVWQDLVATGTEGRNADYWVDETNGTVYVVSRRRFFKHGVRISYDYGDATVKGTVEDLCTVLAAIDVLRRKDKLVNFTEDGGTTSISHEGKIRGLTEESAELFSELYEFVNVA